MPKQNIRKVEIEKQEIKLDGIIHKEDSKDKGCGVSQTIYSSFYNNMQHETSPSPSLMSANFEIYNN